MDCSLDKSERIAQLVPKAAGGDQEAFNELYLLTRDRAYFVAYSITRSEQDALDILQEAYLKAWQKLGTLRDTAQFPAWFRQITGNTAKNFIKRKQPLLFQGGGEDDIDILELQREKDTAYNPDAAMDTAETRRLIMEIVNALPQDQRLCVLMYYYDDIPLSGIAQALEIPEGTVKKRLYLARKKIGGAVEELEERQGIKLYSFAPVPLLIWQLRRLASESAPSFPLPPAILGSAATGTAAAAGGIAAAVTLPKLLAAVAAIVIIGGGAIAGTSLAKRQKPPPADAGTAVVTSVGSTSAAVSTYPSLHDELTSMPESESEEPPSSAGEQTSQSASKPAGGVITQAPEHITVSVTTRYAIPVTVPQTLMVPPGTQPGTTAKPDSTNQAITSFPGTTAGPPATLPVTGTSPPTTLPVTTASPPTTPPPVTEPPVIKLEMNGVAVEYVSGTLPSGTELDVALSGDYNIRVMNTGPMAILFVGMVQLRVNGEVYHPATPVRMRILIPEPYRASPNLAAFQMAGAGMTPLTARTEGDYLVIDEIYL